MFATLMKRAARAAPRMLAVAAAAGSICAGIAPPPLSCSPPSPAPAASSTSVDWPQVYRDIAELLEDVDYDDGSYGPLFVRLAWHAAGTYDKVRVCEMRACAMAMRWLRIHHSNLAPTRSNP